MKRVSLFLLGFLIVSLFLPLYQIPKVKAQESNGNFGNPSVPDIAFVNWTKFWSLFNAHSDWDLEYNNGSGWKSIKSDLQILKNYTQEWLCKITLNFTASYNADYRLTFGIDLDVKNYTHKTDSWNYTISYKNYTVVFDWSDIKDLPLDYVGHGVKPIGDESWFWFRIRKDDVQQGKNVVIDPSFGYETVTGTKINVNDAIRGTFATCPESGTADSITAYIEYDYVVGAGKFKCAIYEGDSSDVTNLVAVTEEIVFDSGDFGPAWQTFDFSDPKPTLTACDYWLELFGEESGGSTVSIYRGTPAGWFISQVSFSYDGFPNPMAGESTAENYAFSIFCNYTVAGAQEYTEEFTETISPSASLYLWKALSEKYIETITVTATSYGWREKASFYTETTTTTTQLNKWNELRRYFTETITITETASFAMGLSIEIIEFVETIGVDASLFVWKAKQFIIEETVSPVANFYDWIELKMTMIEFSELIELAETMYLTLPVPPIEYATKGFVLATIMLLLLIALPILGLIVWRKKG